MTTLPDPTPSDRPAAAPPPAGPAAHGPVEHGPVATLAADFAAMVRFYSRLPVPRCGPADDPAAMPDFARAVCMLPFAALPIALPAALTLAALGLTNLPALAIAGLALAVGLIATGVFHEDGLADVADGFGGGVTVTRKLEIMKDSRIGAFGGAALVLALLVKASLYAGFVAPSGAAGFAEGGRAAAAALVLVGLAPISRVLPLYLFRALPPARADGLGRSVGVPGRATLGIATGLAVGIALGLAGPILGGARVAAALLAGALATAGLGLIAKRQIGGQTGDVLGAGQPIAEIAMLIVLAA